MSIEKIDFLTYYIILLLGLYKNKNEYANEYTIGYNL